MTPHNKQLWLLLGSISILSACRQDDDIVPGLGYEAFDDGTLVEHSPMDESMLERTYTYTYYVSNPSAGGCSSALRLTATGTGITSITPSGCWIDELGPAPSWDALTSASVNSLLDTWFIRGTAFDKDNVSANYQAWCGTANQVRVRVVATTVSHLYFMFTDDYDCFF